MRVENLKKQESVVESVLFTMIFLFLTKCSHVA